LPATGARPGRRARPVKGRRAATPSAKALFERAKERNEAELGPR